MRILFSNISLRVALLSLELYYVAQGIKCVLNVLYDLCFLLNILSYSEFRTVFSCILCNILKFYVLRQNNTHVNQNYNSRDIYFSVWTSVKDSWAIGFGKLYVIWDFSMCVILGCSFPKHRLHKISLVSQAMTSNGTKDTEPASLLIRWRWRGLREPPWVPQTHTPGTRPMALPPSVNECETCQLRRYSCARD